jgi:hypothetical protein
MVAPADRQQSEGAGGRGQRNPPAGHEGQAYLVRLHPPDHVTQTRPAWSRDDVAPTRALAASGSERRDVSLQGETRLAIGSTTLRPVRGNPDPSAPRPASV